MSIECTVFYFGEKDTVATCFHASEKNLKSVLDNSVHYDIIKVSKDISNSKGENENEKRNSKRVH